LLVVRRDVRRIFDYRALAELVGHVADDPVRELERLVVAGAERLEAVELGAGELAQRRARAARQREGGAGGVGDDGRVGRPDRLEAARRVRARRLLPADQARAEALVGADHGPLASE